MRLIALTEADIDFYDNKFVVKRSGAVWLNPAQVISFKEIYSNDVKWVHITLTDNSINVCETLGEVLTIIQDF